MKQLMTWAAGPRQWSPRVCLSALSIASLLVAGGCSDDTSEDDHGTEQTDQGADINDDSSGGDIGSDVTADAANDEGTGLVTEPMVVEGESGQDCSAVCGGFNITCADTCELGDQTTVGLASYGRINFETGFNEYTDPVYHDTCDSTPESRVEADGNTYNLATWSCCCEAPVVTTVAGDVATRAACDDICADEGYTGCAEYYDWGSDSGGVEMTYLRAETGGRAYITGGCASEPAERINYAQAWRDLESYRCACY